MYIIFALVSMLVVASQSDTNPIPRDINIVSLFGYGIWILVTCIHLPYICGGRQVFAWGGLYSYILFFSLQAGTITIFGWTIDKDRRDIYGEMGLQSYLLVFMSVTIFVYQRILRPSYRKLFWFYHGTISNDEVKKVPPICGISNEALMKLASDACKMVGISDEASNTIQQCLNGQRISEDEDEAISDWTLTINKLTKAVSFAPFRTPKSRITSAQCQKLVCQIILFLRVYMETGKIRQNQGDTKETAQMNVGEALVTMFRIALQLPISFVVAMLPRTVYAVIHAAINPYALGKFMNGVAYQDNTMALNGFITLILSIFIAPLINIFSSLLESKFATNMIDECRHKMLSSTLKGGMEFDEVHRPGKLVDTFSSQVNQVELFCQNFFIQLTPIFAQVIAGVTVSAIQYPFAVILFISLLPIMMSIEYFDDRATLASSKKTNADAKLMSKITSSVECRKAIRMSNSVEWIANDMEKTLEFIKITHFESFFRSSLVLNFIDFGGAFFIVLILFPLGLNVINGRIPLGTFATIMGATSALVMPISSIGEILNQTTLYTGAIQSVIGLMDDSLNEQTASKLSATKAVLKKLSKSFSINGIKFHYDEKLSDVLKGVNVELTPGMYVVLCGGSGSGKTTLLNLLMRFEEPYEGSVEWDEMNIYSTSLESFREHVGVMFQQTMVYQATVRDNILFGMPEVPGAVEKAAKDAEISEVIECLPNGYDTVIGGDMIVGMSGGQLQRICLARALYKKPSVLLLDEATSALDAETERAIIKTIVKLRDKEGITVVSVSHRPSTAVKADKILVLDQGIIAEQGTYDELVSCEGGLFRRMVDSGEDIE